MRLLVLKSTISICCRPFSHSERTRWSANEIDVVESLLPAGGRLILSSLSGPGSADRRGDDAEVFGALVGADVEKTVAMIDVVLVVGFARDDHFQAPLSELPPGYSDIQLRSCCPSRPGSLPCRACGRQKHQTARPCLHKSDRSCRCPIRDGKICRSAW